MNVGVAITSRNNYSLLDKCWIPNIGEKVDIINVDEGSDDSEKEYGKSICDKYGIKYIDSEVSGVQNNAKLFCDHFKDKYDYFIWFHTDCWPIEQDFFKRFSDMSGSFKKFGAIGFNAFASDVSKNWESDHIKYKDGGKVLGVFARSGLTKYKWQTGTHNVQNTPIVPNVSSYSNLFAIESVAWFAIGINIQLFLNTIKVDNNYGFFHAWDDVCLQFLKNNIYNVHVSDLGIVHRPDLKPNFGLPACSVKPAKKGNNKFHIGWGHLDIWKNKWGYDWENYKSFESVKHKYNGTLLKEYYEHDYNVGPVRNFK